MDNENQLVISKNTIDQFNAILPRYMSAVIGTQFRNHRDYYQVFGWERTITARLCYALYKSHGIAKAVNDTPVNTTWRYFPQIKSSNAKFMENLNAINSRMKILDAMKKADRLSGVGFYSIIVFDIKGQKYSSKLRSFKLQNLKSLSVYSDWEVEIVMKRDSNGVAYDIDYYQIGQYKVHPSRVVHVCESPDNNILGQSRIAPIYNQLYDMWKISGSTSELYYITASLLLNAKAMDGFKVNKSDGAELQDSLLEVVNKMKGFIITNGFEIDNIAPKITSPKDSWDVMEKFISAESGIPRRILFGSEMGELASTQDQITYYERIESRQINHVTPNISNAVLDKLIRFSDMPFAKYEVVWKQLSALNEKEISESIEKYANSLSKIAELNINDVTGAISEKMIELIRGTQ